MLLTRNGNLCINIIMNKKRLECYNKLENLLKANIITYFTGDRRGLETQIHHEVYELFAKHLKKMERKRIVLLLYTQGGETIAGWSLVNLIRAYAKDFEVIVPSKALSTGTLICLGADKIHMNNDSLLGPIDPSVNTPLNPKLENDPMGRTYPVSVEAIKGFIELAKSEFGVKDSVSLSSVLISLTNRIHPMVLGEVFRRKSQIKMLAEKLLNSRKISKMKKIDKNKIISFLCSDSGSHDYTIHYAEAKSELKLPVTKMSKEMDNIVSQIYIDLRNELELDKSFPSYNKEKKNYLFKRAVIESVNFSSDVFITEQRIETDDKNGFRIIPINEGWRHV